MLHPRGKVRGPVLMRLPLRLPAFIPLVFWVGFQAVMFSAADGEAVSWPAHVGGIIARGQSWSSSYVVVPFRCSIGKS